MQTSISIPRYKTNGNLKWKVQVAQSCPTLATPWTIQSMESLIGKKNWIFIQSHTRKLKWMNCCSTQWQRWNSKALYWVKEVRHKRLHSTWYHYGKFKNVQHYMVIEVTIASGEGEWIIGKGRRHQKFLEWWTYSHLDLECWFYKCNLSKVIKLYILDVNFTIENWL